MERDFPLNYGPLTLTGYNERMVKTPSDGSDPSWSSLLTK